MIIVHPDEGVSLRAVSDGIRKTLVYCFVRLPICRFEVAKVLQIMKQRPDHLVGITVVKFVALGPAKSNRHYFVTGVTCRFGERTLRDFARNSGPSNPDTTAFPQHRLHCSNEASDSRRHRPKLFACRIEREWQSIGNDDQTVHFRKLKG